MYQDFFGFSRPPFRITPDTELFHDGGRRGEILEALVYAISNGEGMVKVVGEVGTGKTMLCRMLELRVPPQVEIVYLANPSLTPEDILHAIALEMDLAVDPRATRLQVMHALHQRLLAKHSHGQRVVVLVEEAQGMPLATLEEIRLLSNLETHRDKLLQIVLFGQPELDANLAVPEIRQLRERITHSFRLEPLSRTEVRDYVEHRLRAAGYRGPSLFRKAALAALAHGSEGLTRRVNIIADKALLAAYADDTHDVRRRHVMTAIADSEFHRREGRRFHVPETAMTVGLGLLAGIFLLLLIAREPLWRPSSAIAATAPQAETPAATQPAAGAATASGETGSAARSTPIPAERTALAAAPAPTAAPAPAVAKAPAVAPVPAETPTLTVAPATAAVSASTARPAPAAAPEVRVAMAEASRPAASAPQPSEIASRLAEPAPVATSEGAPAAASGGAATADAPTPVAESARPSGPAPASAGSAAAAIAPAGDILDQRLAASRDWLSSEHPGRYSIQILITDSGHRRNLVDFLQGRERAGQIGDIYVYETLRGGVVWYGVLFGSYSNFGDARDALDALSPQLNRYGPFIRNVDDVANRA